jgi:hypothetical protein
MAGEFETLHALTAYHDGIVAGIADLRGAAHVFTLEDRAESEAFAVYRLRAVPQGAFPSSGDYSSDDYRSIDIWSPSADVEALVTTVSAAEDDGFVARGEFVPVDPSPVVRPALRVRW